MTKNFQDFISAQLDCVAKKYDKDEYEYQNQAFDEFYEKIERYVAENCDGLTVQFGEFDPDYDSYEQVLHDALANIKGHFLVDYITVDLIGVEIYVLLLKKGE